MARLSILIPCFSDKAMLEQTLLSILSASATDVQVVVVDRSGYADPYGLAGSELELVNAPRGSTLCDLLQLGLSRVAAPIVHVMGSGLEVRTDWFEPALSWFDDEQIGCVSPVCWEANEERSEDVAVFGVRATRKGRRIEVESQGRESVRDCHGLGVIGPAWYAAFFRTDALHDLHAFEGGYGESFADLDAAIRLNYAGYSCVVEPRAQLSNLQACELLPESSFRQGRNEWRFGRDYATQLNSLSRQARGQSVRPSFVDPYRLLTIAGRFAEALGKRRSSRRTVALHESTDKCASAHTEEPIRRAA